MRIGIISNLNNGIGLERDWLLLREFLEGLDHEVVGFQYDAPVPTDLSPCHLAISLEVVERKFFHIAPVHYIFCNPEWTYQRDLETIGSQFAKIFCKTREAERVFIKLFPGKTHYTGFLARDQYDATVPRKAKCLHVAGNASLEKGFRGTQAVLDAWRWTRNGERIGLELVIVGQMCKDVELPEWVTLLERVSEEELKHLQNECAFHLYPCGTEGFGHALHEALSVGARILTTSAPPMDEIRSAFHLPVTGKTVRNLANIYEVSALHVHQAVKASGENLPQLRRLYHNQAARIEFLEGNAAFKFAFSVHLETFDTKPLAVATPVARGKKRIAFLGNFAAPESTENMVKWALEALDYEVYALQENAVTMRDLECNCDAFLWVRTPGWLRVPDAEMERFLKNLSVPSFGIHLDKFWDIPEREALIGRHPFWKMTHLFTADGSRDADFKARGVNHHWMKPAMSEVYLHPGRWREEYACDVGFVGARGYHKEYPFREKLIAFLEETYGARFRHITSIRGHDLNDFYASCKVTVGDCFGGGRIPRYWSDRVPETCGRGGFLLHPEVEGFDIPVATYKPGDLDDLREKIDSWLVRDFERKGKIYACAEHVRKCDTWTIALREILEKVWEHERTP